MKYITSNIKRVVAFSMTVLFSLIFNSCENSLDLTNPNQPTPDSFWRDGTDAESGLISVYASLPTVHLFGRLGTGVFLIQRSDIANTFPQDNVNNAGTFSAHPDYPRMREVWPELYRIVASANQVIGRVPDIDMDGTRKTEILGEAHFLRGFAFFYLLNLWGAVPMPLVEAQSLEDIFLPASSEAEIWATIESDFSTAQKNLPSDNSLPRGEVGRPTWAAATGMLGKALLFQDKWTQAAAEFKKIVDADDYTLVSDFSLNSSEAGNNNAESLFEIQLDGNASGGWGSAGNNAWRGQGWEADIAPRGYTSQQSMAVNQWVLDLFLAQTTNANGEDPRAAATIIWDYPGAKVYQDDFADAFQGDDLNRVWVRKYLNFDPDHLDALTPGSWAGSTSNLRMLRYADVLLMYAEAENEANGGSAAAHDAINEVRGRADMPDYVGLDQASLRTAIRDERVRELAIEGHRWFDLKRWGILEERFSDGTFKSNSRGVWEAKHEYLPIPRPDVESNPNLEQNPLWK
ncbi:MAG: RagB/SusD family nutrient uptake outer membrane protein [Cyclobacteriaceae bacterium]